MKRPEIQLGAWVDTQLERKCGVVIHQITPKKPGIYCTKSEHDHPEFTYFQKFDERWYPAYASPAMAERSHGVGEFSPIAYCGLAEPYVQLYIVKTDGEDLCEIPVVLNQALRILRKKFDGVNNEHLESVTIDPIDFSRFKLIHTTLKGCHPLPTREKAR